VRALVVIALVGCGRVAFDPIVDGAADTATLPAVCGDGVCEGGAGELCSTCSDCATAALVCGNGECTAGEDGASCYADCGPSPWPWTDDAAQMLATINQARTQGTMCPGGGMTLTAPALTYDTALEVVAREWAWEAAHENWGPPDSCNGRLASDRLGTVGASSGWKSFGGTTGPEGAAALIAFMPACNQIMNPSNTLLGAAAAYDVINAHAIMLR